LCRDFSYGAEDFSVHLFQTEYFVAFLRQQARAIIKEKSDKCFLNPCLFAPPPGAEGYRRMEYFKQASFFLLDFDDGELSPEKFASIFWDDAGRGRKRSFVICNSYSRSAGTPNKFRVVMFYKRAATSLEQHKAVYKAIVARLEEHGFTAASARLDPQCKSGVQSFYLPCTNRDHPDWALFKAYGTKSRDLERCSIDPILHGKTAVLSDPVPSITLNSIVWSCASRDQIDVTTANLRTLTTGRHEAIFDTAKELCRLGLSRAEVEAELLQAVGNESKMRKKVSDALRSLTKYGWFSERQRGFSSVVMSDGGPQANTETY
jgi:hypothetical protein